MIALDWRPVARGALQGFFDLQLDSGFTVHDCLLFEQSGKRWIGLPSKPQIEDGRVRKDPETSKVLYTPVISIRDREVRDKFNRQALAALDRLLGTGEP